MGLFDKKFCDICGEKISLLGNRKLEDGNMCSTCAKRISPFMTDRRKTSVAEMKEHLAYRDANKQKLAAFSANETYGESKKVYIDRANGTFVVSSYSPGNWEKENPDVIPFSEVSGCNLDVKEKREEEFTKDAQGNRIRYNPPRYRYEYDFYVKISLTNKWFNEIELKLNNFDVEGLNSQKYHNYQMMAQQIINALTGNSVNFTQGQGYGFNERMGGMGTAAGIANAFVNQVAQNAQQVQNGGQPQFSQPQYQQNAQPGYGQPQYQQNAQPGYNQPQYQQPPVQAAGPWICPSCNSQNNGMFCEFCGTKKP